MVKVAPVTSLPGPVACDSGVTTLVAAVNPERTPVARPAAAGRFAIGRAGVVLATWRTSWPAPSPANSLRCVRGNPERRVAQQESEHAVRVLGSRREDVELRVVIGRHRQPQVGGSPRIELREHRRRHIREPNLGENRAASGLGIAAHDGVLHGHHVVDRGAHVGRAKTHARRHRFVREEIGPRWRVGDSRGPERSDARQEIRAATVRTRFR